jgi:hypothetical protein
LDDVACMFSEFLNDDYIFLTDSAR